MPKVGEKTNGTPASALTTVARMDSILKRNEAVKTEIETKLDHLSALWNAIEGKLLGMQPPRHIRIYYETIEHEDGRGPSEYKCLGLQRFGGKWRICFAWDADWIEEALDWRPVVDCSTEIRVEAAKHIEKLMEEIVKSGKEYIPEVDEAVRALENALADV